MEQREPQHLSSSFGAAAAAYAEHRPDYARAPVHWALALDRTHAFLASRPETARGEFTVPMLTGVLRAQRL